MCWLVAIRGGLAKICIRACLPFTRMCMDRRRVWGRLVERRLAGALMTFGVALGQTPPGKLPGA